MKQLNNKEEGKSIVLDINEIAKAIKSNTIVYIEYQVGIEEGIKASHKFENIKLKDLVTESTDFLTVILETLKAEKFPGYEISEDIQNWKSDTKGIRFFLSAIKIQEALKTRGSVDEDPFLAVIDNIARDAQSDTELIIDEYPTFSLVYANSIASENQSAVDPEVIKVIDADGNETILNEGGSVIIEYKLV